MYIKNNLVYAIKKRNVYISNSFSEYLIIALFKKYCYDL